MVDGRRTDGTDERAVDLGCALVLFILLHECNQLFAVGAFAVRTAVEMKHQLGKLLQRLFGAIEFGNAEVEFGNHAVKDSIAVK